MRRLEALFASTAIALVLATSPLRAAPDDLKDTAKIAAAVPVPDVADVKPPTAADLNPTNATPPSATPDAAPAAATPAPEAPKAVTAPEPNKTVTTPEPAKPVAGLSAQDQAVADKIKDLLNTKADRIFAGKKERTSVEAFYATRNYAPLWSSEGAATGLEKAAATYLQSVDGEGLDPADYPVPSFAAGATADALADAELRLTASVITFAHHASAGRVHYSRVAADIVYDLTIPEPNDVLAKIAGAKNVGDALASYNPQQPGYKALKSKLAEIRGQKSEAGPAPIAQGPVLKLGKTVMSDPRVPQLRERLGLAAGQPTDLNYDKPLADAVKTFQAQKGLSASGNLTGSTVEVLNGGPKRDGIADIIIANMERWRWIPRDLGESYVMLNIPDFTLRVIDHGKLLWTTRVVTGKPSTPTPLLSETMKYITVNPTWNVPPSIINNEYLPALQQDPQALERIGLRVETNRDGTLHIFQPPGEGNALGRIRFNFPNKFLVYQHDTPDKNLFAKDERAYSHGCMRVQNPDKYAEVLLSVTNPKEGYTAEGIRKMYGSGERQIDLQKHIPVHITYQTAFVDDAGKLELRKDVYGRDARLLAILKGDERKVADIAIERANPTVTRAPRAPANLAIAGGYGSSGPSFFEVLFGGGRTAPPPPPAPVRRRGPTH